MKIIHITPDVNFATKFVLPVAAIQSVNDNEVTVFTYSNEYRGSGRSVKDLELQYPTICFFELNIKVRANFRSYLKSLLRLISKIKRVRPDVVVFHTSLDSFFPLMIVRVLLKNAKLIYFNHGVTFLGYRALLRIFFKIIEISNLSCAQLSLTISPSMREALLDVAPGSSSVVLVNPGSACGIELISNDFDKIVRMRAATREALGIPKDELVVIYVGRPVKRKGFFDLLAAWHVFEGKPQHRLLLLGPSRTDKVDLAQTMPSNIHFLGYQADPNPFYLVADVLCIPSYHEGLGYCYLEAAAAGCVPISCNIPGPTDFIQHRETGMTCNINDPQSIADSLSLLLSDRSLREYLARNAFAKALTFDRSKIAPRIVEVLRGD